MNIGKLLFILLSIFFIVTPGYSLIIKQGESLVIPEDDIIYDDLLIFAKTIDIKGSVKGDIIAVAQNVSISGLVDGSIFTGGATVDIDADKVKSIWAGGGSINIAGTIYNNVLLFGGSLLVEENTIVGKDILVYGDHLTINGDISDKIRGRLSELVVAGKAGNVNVQAEKVKILKTAQIFGDLVVRGEEEPIIEEGAEILGEKRYKKLKLEEKISTEETIQVIAPFVATILWLMKLVIFISKIVVGVVLIALLKGYVRRIMDTVINEPWKSLGWGFLGMIVIPVAAIILLVTMIGFPFGFLGIYVFSILFYLSSIIIGILIGEKIIQLFKVEGEISLYLSLIVGILVLWVLGLIPGLNLLIRIAVLLFGAGGLLFGSWNVLKEARARGMI